MNRPVNQHWVPQFYLKYFATVETKETKNSQVWIFSKNKDDGDPVLTNVKNVCGKRYLYSPCAGDGQRDWGLEDKLSDLESMLAPIWPSLAEGYVDLKNQSIRKALSLFVAALCLRHPDTSEQCKDIYRHLMHIYDRAPKDLDGIPDIEYIEISGEKYRFDTRDWDDYKNWKDNDHHKFFVDSVHSHTIEMATIFLKKRWSIIVSDTPSFITSDKPVSKEHLREEKFGFGTKGTIITFPLSPTRLLIMDDMHEQPSGEYYPISAEGPGIYNFLIWRSASRFMVSPRDR